MIGKNNTKNYCLIVEQEKKKRFKMWKKKKHWVYGAILFLGAGAAITLNNGKVQAAVITTDNTTQSEQLATPTDTSETTDEGTPQTTTPTNTTESAEVATESATTSDTTESGIDSPKEESTAATNELLQEPVATDDSTASTNATNTESPTDASKTSQTVETPTTESTQSDNQATAAPAPIAESSTAVPTTQPTEDTTPKVEYKNETVSTPAPTEPTDLNDQFTNWTATDLAHTTGTGKFTVNGQEYEVSLTAPVPQSLDPNGSILHPLVDNTIKKTEDSQSHTYSYIRGSSNTSWYYTTDGASLIPIKPTDAEFAAAKYYTSTDEFGNGEIARVVTVGNYQISEQVQITQDGKIQHFVTILNTSTNTISGLNGMGVSLDTMLDDDDQIPIISDGTGGISIQNTGITLYCTPEDNSAVFAGRYYDMFRTNATPAAGTTAGTTLKKGVDTNILYETPITTLAPNQLISFGFAERVLVNTELTQHFVDTEGKTIAPDQVIGGQPGETFNVTPLTIAGYTYQSTTGSSIGTFTVDDTEVTFVYQANPAELTISYVDDENNGSIVGTPETKTGVTDGTGTYTVKVPTNYALADGQSDSISYTFAPDANTSDNITIHLVHVHESGQMSTKQTIHYTGAGPATPEDHIQAVTWTVDKDKVTNVSTFTPTGDYVEVATPVIAGYTPDQPTVSAEDLGTTTTAPTDSKIVVSYSGDVQKGAVIYFDDTTNQWLKTDQLSGSSNEESSYTTTSTLADFENQGYELVSDGYPSTGVQFDTDQSIDQIYSVHLKHGTKVSNETTTITETIDYVYADGTKAADSSEQRVSFTRNVTLDQVTGITSYSDWEAISNTDFAAVISPQISGFTTDQAVIAETSITPDSTDLHYVVTYNKIPTSQPSTTPPAGEEKVTGTEVPSSNVTKVTPLVAEATKANASSVATGDQIVSNLQSTKVEAIPAEKSYPKTGEEKTGTLSFVGGLIIAGLGIFGMAKKKSDFEHK